MKNRKDNKNEDKDIFFFTTAAEDTHTFFLGRGSRCICGSGCCCRCGNSLGVGAICAAGELDTLLDETPSDETANKRRERGMRQKGRKRERVREHLT